MKKMNMMAVMMAMFVAPFTANAVAMKNNTSDAHQKEVVFKKGQNQRKVVYQTDDQGRVVCKTSYYWNELFKTWDPMTRYSVLFEDGKTKVVFAAWNKDSHQFSNHQTMQIFDSSEFPIIFQLPE